VAGAAERGMNRVTQRVFEPVAIELAVRLHVSDDWLDRAAPPDHRAQASRDTASQPWVIDADATSAR
jgi:hypothetical protein